MNAPARSRLPRTRRWLLRNRLHAPTSHAESLRLERVIALSRLILTAITAVQLWIDTAEPASYAPAVHVFLVLFAAHSLAALFVLRARQQTSRAFALTTTAVDFLGAAATLPLVAPASSFFAFFFFVLASSAFRWGYRETMALTCVAVGLVLLHANLAVVPATSSAAGVQPFGLEQVIGRVAYLTMMGLVLGYLAEETRLLRAEAWTLAWLLGRIRVDAGVARSVAAMTKDIVAVFDAARLVVVIEDRENQRSFRWDTKGGWSVLPGDVSSGGRSGYAFVPAPLSLAITRRRWPFSSPWHVVAINTAGRQVDAVVDVAQAFAAAYDFRTVVTTPLSFGGGWTGRVFLFDPRVDMRPVALTQLLQTIVRQVGPAVFGVHLMGQLRTRAGAIERARVARELHDGVIQSLIGIEMRIDVLKRERDVRETPAAEELFRLQQAVRHEVLNLRDLMQQMRPVEFNPDELLDYLADLVQRFGRDTGITARFLTELHDVRLPWRVCLEIVRIVREGLVNIRKHSAATSVVVRFGVREEHWAIEIDDNGRGFPFAGRLLHTDLEHTWRGPIVIKERVKAIGGQINIDSTPGEGTRLEIRIPREGHV